VAVWLAATAAHRAQAVAFVLAAVAFTSVTVVALADLPGLDETLSRDDGSVARTMALGTLFLVAAVTGLYPARS
jgi:hypothetical protein